APVSITTGKEATPIS
ncbi:hypothetical protein CP8484711_1491, partial [Chlamydia psittaci 84-8471/1]